MALMQKRVIFSAVSFRPLTAADGLESRGLSRSTQEGKIIAFEIGTEHSAKEIGRGNFKLSTAVLTQRRCEEF
jgi:hypothetical protein